jgi:chromosome segregation ATPase
MDAKKPVYESDVHKLEVEILKNLSEINAHLATLNGKVCKLENSDESQWSRINSQRETCMSVRLGILETMSDLKSLMESLSIRLDAQSERNTQQDKEIENAGEKIRSIIQNNQGFVGTGGVILYLVGQGQGWW